VSFSFFILLLLTRCCSLIFLVIIMNFNGLQYLCASFYLLIICNFLFSSVIINTLLVRVKFVMCDL
jgi:hypothetical protein